MARLTSLLVLLMLSYVCHSGHATSLSISDVQEFRVESRAFGKCFRKCKQTLWVMKKFSPEIRAQGSIATNDSTMNTPGESKNTLAASQKSDKIVCINLCFAILSPDPRFDSPRPRPDQSGTPLQSSGPVPILSPIPVATKGHYCHCAGKTLCSRSFRFFRRCICTSFRCRLE